MIVTILDQKYKCGCERGITEYKYPGVLYKLNSIIEWENSKFPEKLIETVDKELPGNVSDPSSPATTVSIPILEENRDFLGDDLELVPGNCFLIDGQVIAIDSHDRLVLVFSETGRNSLDRFIEEKLTPELELTKEDTTGIITLSWKDLDIEPNESEYDGKVIVPYPKYKIWKDKFINGRDIKTTEDNHINIKIDLKYSGLIIPVSFIFRDWDVLYKTEDFEEDEEDLLNDILNKIMSYLFMSYERVYTKKSYPTKEEQIKSFVDNYMNKK